MEVFYNIGAIVLAFSALIVSIWTATVTVNKRCLKDFFIGEYKMLMDEYREFVVAMRTGMLSAEDIKDTLNHFSHKIHTLDVTCKSLYKTPLEDILIIHGHFQYDITELKSIDEQYKKDRVIFNAKDKQVIYSKYQLVDKSFISQIVKLNGAHLIRKKYNWSRL